MSISVRSDRRNYPAIGIPRTSLIRSQALTYRLVDVLLFLSIAFPELQFRVQGLPLDLLDVGWAVVFFHLIWTGRNDRAMLGGIPRQRLYWLFLLLHFPGGIVSSILSLTPAKALYWMFRYLVAVSTYFTIATLTRDSRHLVRWATILMLGMLFQSSLGVGETLLPRNGLLADVMRFAGFSREALLSATEQVGIGMSEIYSEGSIIAETRVSGSLWNAAGYGDFLVLGYCLAAGILLSYGGSRHRSLVYLTLPLVFLGVMFSGARSSYISFAVCTIYVLIKTRSARLILPLIAVVILFNTFGTEYTRFRIASLTSYEQVSSQVSHRFGLERWSAWWSGYVREQPVLAMLGSGFGATRTGLVDIDSSQAAAGMHNLYARLAAKVGIIAFVVFLVFVSGLWQQLGRLYKGMKHNTERMAMLGARCTIIVFFVSSLSNHYMITIVGGWRYIWILFGVIAGLITIHQHQEVNA
jgi:hypothetical protein